MRCLATCRCTATAPPGTLHQFVNKKSVRSTFSIHYIALDREIREIRCSIVLDRWTAKSDRLTQQYVRFLTYNVGRSDEQQRSILQNRPVPRVEHHEKCKRQIRRWAIYDSFLLCSAALLFCLFTFEVPLTTESPAGKKPVIDRFIMTVCTPKADHRTTTTPRT